VQSLLAPLTAFTLLLTIILAPCFLPERILTVDIIATVLVCSGAIVTTIFGTHSQQLFDEPALRAVYTRTYFIVFQILVFCTLTGLAVWLRFSPDPFPKASQAAVSDDASQNEESVQTLKDGKEAESPNHTDAQSTSSSEKSHAESSLPTSSPSGPSSNDKQRAVNQTRGFFSRLLEPEVPSIKRRWFHLPEKLVPFAYAFVAALSGAQQLAATKTFAELVLLSLQGYNQLKFWVAWIIFFFAIFFAVLQIWYLSAGLERCDAIFFLSIYNALLIIFSVVCGGVYFGEFAQAASTANLVLFFLGLVVVLSGVLVLVRRPPQHDYAPLSQADSEGDPRKPEKAEPEHAKAT